MKLGLNLVGILVLLTGAIWFLQGIGILQGFWMSNQPQWLLIGLLLMIVSVGALILNNRRRERP